MIHCSLRIQPARSASPLRPPPAVLPPSTLLPNPLSDPSVAHPEWADLSYHGRQEIINRMVINLPTPIQTFVQHTIYRIAAQAVQDMHEGEGEAEYSLYRINEYMDLHTPAEVEEAKDEDKGDEHQSDQDKSDTEESDEEESDEEESDSEEPRKEKADEAYMGRFRAALDASQRAGAYAGGLEAKDDSESGDKETEDEESGDEAMEE